MHGVIAAVPTPIDGDGSPDRAMFLEHCSWALAHGCDGLNVLGSTGEANSFDTATRKSIMGWAAEGLDLTRLMVGTGTPSIAETIDLTIAADEMGYTVALVLPPYYYKPVSEQGLFDWYARLHDALGDRRISLYFYNFPQLTGVPIPVPLIERLHSTWPERFAGIKDSSGDLAFCRDLAARLPGLAVFPSSEVSLGEAARSGFAGCISATANQTAELCGKVWADRASPESGTLDRIKALRELIAAQPLVPAVKYLVARRTGVSQWARVLPPFTELGADAQAGLSLALTAPN
jgi:4-hydroxy-tetrahydrodipicolinate synthase